MEAKTDALVNTVNTVGVMGKGIALQFKHHYPENFKAYQKAAKDKKLSIGQMFVYELTSLNQPRFIINFPTKEHWRSPSKLEHIQAGLIDLVRVIQAYSIRSIAVPALGCSNGGLQWSEVRPLIEHALSPLEGLEVMLFEPQGSDLPKKLKSVGQKPSLTAARAALLKLIQQYQNLGDDLGRLEVQKLSYFLQNSGFDIGMKLNFVKQQYGPYADAVRHVLLALEGHYLGGVGDFSQQRSYIHVLPNLYGEIDQALHTYPQGIEAVDKVAKLIEGFETPFGMELLATVHWVIAQEKAHSEREVVEAIWAWNPRKQKLFSESLILLALDHLKSQGWLENQPQLQTVG